MNKVLVFTKESSPRFNYVFQHIGGYFANLNFELCHDQDTYLQWSGPSIHCGNQKLKEKEWRIQVSHYFSWPLERLLAEGDSFLQSIICDTEINQDFDIISSIFWQLTRIEEYFPHPADAHGRYPASQSLLTKKNLLRIPLVDLWIFEWRKQLESHFGLEIRLNNVNPSWSVGMDIDQFYKHSAKPLYQKTGGLFKDLMNGNLTNVRERLKIYSGLCKDPFDIYDNIAQMHLPKDSLYFFILSGGQSPFDKNHSLEQQSIRHKISELEALGEIGLHPSYDTMTRAELIHRELKLLQSCCDKPIMRSRQHYLRFRLPTTYRLLIGEGIQMDYSMVYAAQTGFRASCCRPFYWYDIEQENTTSLKVIPCAAMDRTYLTYLKFERVQVVKDVRELWQTTQKYGGHLHMIWHNSSFDFKGEWQGWEGVFEEIIELLRRSQ